MKLAGAALIIICCGWFGYSLSAAHKKEEKYLRQLISAMDYIQCEIQCRLTPLPELCAQVASSCGKGAVQTYFLELSNELRQQISIDAKICVDAALDKVSGLTSQIKECIQELGKCLGAFDLDGQLAALEAARAYCREHLEQHCAGKEEQRRSYQTLGICAGAALVIVLI